jgi:hypothetical protein
MDVAVLQKLFLSRRLQVEKLRMPAKIKGEWKARSVHKLKTLLNNKYLILLHGTRWYSGNTLVFVRHSGSNFCRVTEYSHVMVFLSLSKLILGYYLPICHAYFLSYRYLQFKIIFQPHSTLYNLWLAVEILSLKNKRINQSINQSISKLFTKTDSND